MRAQSVWDEIGVLMGATMLAAVWRIFKGVVGGLFVGARKVTTILFSMAGADVRMYAH